MLKIIIIQVLLISSAISQIFITEPNESIDDPGNCYYEPFNLTFAPGTTYQQGCTIYKCYEDYSVSGAGCGLISIPDETCHVRPVNTSLAYPECCPKVICEDPAPVTDAETLIIPTTAEIEDPTPVTNHEPNKKKKAKQALRKILKHLHH